MFKFKNHHLSQKNGKCTRTGCVKFALLYIIVSNKKSIKLLKSPNIDPYSLILYILLPIQKKSIKYIQEEVVFWIKLVIRRKVIFSQCIGFQHSIPSKLINRKFTQNEKFHFFESWLFKINCWTSCSCYYHVLI